ncbi:hypothetical protein GIB67_029828 [Kingdonia uniflora]|uniref:Protein TRIGALACTOSYLDIACYLGLYCEROL 4, chloroplastic n=1 Tax=Kingdonia uniflora TaxID=39325 RepID=A0A7J7NJK9_9MAGN|nr:hypothetical protein GIB67_029828 [Kingdonia uniflora]
MLDKVNHSLGISHKYLLQPLAATYSRPIFDSLEFIDNNQGLKRRRRSFSTVLGQFNIQKFISSVKESCSSESFWLKNVGGILRDKSLYALNFCSEFLITSDDTLLLSTESYGDKKMPRKKAFPNHNLTVETVWPGLFVDNVGTYWDVPLMTQIDLASNSSDSGPSYHLCLHHNSGTAKELVGDQAGPIPPSLLPGLCVKTAFSIKKNMDIWRSKAGKLKMVQPFDIFLSDPCISASGILGTVLNASFGDNSVRSQRDEHSQGFNGFSVCDSGKKSALLADLFASISCNAQHGNFQRLFLDLTRVHARLDFPSGSTFLTGATHLAQDLYNSQPSDLEVVQAVCPNVTLSLQQQIFGEFSFRVDSRLAFDLKRREWHPRVDETVFAVEYAMKVLGSAKAVAWYSTKSREAMVELRFFET